MPPMIQCYQQYNGTNDTIALYYFCFCHSLCKIQESNFSQRNKNKWLLLSITYVRSRSQIFPRETKGKAPTIQWGLATPAPFSPAGPGPQRGKVLALGNRVPRPRAARGPCLGETLLRFRSRELPSRHFLVLPLFILCPYWAGCQGGGLGGLPRGTIPSWPPIRSFNEIFHRENKWLLLSITYVRSRYQIFHRGNRENPPYGGWGGFQLSLVLVHPIGDRGPEFLPLEKLP